MSGGDQSIHGKRCLPSLPTTLPEKFESVLMKVATLFRPNFRGGGSPTGDVY